MSDPAVRVRGIYATALTEHLRDRARVVSASEPIRERFDEPFPPAHHDVAVADAADRQGVEVTGDPDAVATVADALDVARDSFVWTDATPAGAVYAGRVTETLGGGAVVDLGDGEGYLPYGNSDERVETGDVLRVQVAEPRAPWSDDRPVLDARLRVDAGLVTLVRGGSRSTQVAWEDLLSADPPDGWAARWAPSADDADVDALDAALADAADRAAAVEAALGADGDGRERDDDGGGDPDAPARLAAERATRWAWFGRESRFALDERRRAVTTTMPGHHRIKAGGDGASAAVDFAEAVCEPGGEFPFDAVSRQFGPAEGDEVTLGHGKPDGRLIVLGRGEVTDRDPSGQVTVRREMSPGGTYDALGVQRRAGDVAVTRLREGRWWYPTVYRSAEGDTRGTYVNVCTPLELFPTQARYVDLHVDVVRHADGTVERVDDDELDAAVERGHISAALAERARAVAASIEEGLG